MFRPNKPTTDPTSPSPETARADSRPSSTTDHFDDIRIPPDPGAADTAGAGDARSTSGPEQVISGRVLSRDEFFAAFRALFKGANAVRYFRGDPALESLIIAPDDASARAASDALYDTALEVPWLRWLIEPFNKWMERAFVVGIFAYGRGELIMAELAARAAEAPEARHDAPSSQKDGPDGDGPDGDDDAPEASTELVAVSEPIGPQPPEVLEPE